MEEKVFVVHGGSAINLFVRNLPRYSVDIDLTYIPLESREESLEHINAHLMSIAAKAKRAFPGMHIVPKHGYSDWEIDDVAYCERAEGIKAYYLI